MTVESGVGEVHPVGRPLQLDHANGGLESCRSEDHSLNNDGTDGDTVVGRADVRVHPPGCEDPVGEERIYGSIEVTGERSHVSIVHEAATRDVITGGVRFNRHPLVTNSGRFACLFRS